MLAAVLRDRGDFGSGDREGDDVPPAAAISESVRVTEVACYRVAVSSTGEPYAMSGGRRYSDWESAIVKVTASDGTAGFGEGSTLGSNYVEGFFGSTVATVRELAPIVFGCSISQAGTLVREMDRAVLGHLPGKAAIDIAMWDLRARLLGLPVADLLGGVQQSSLDAFTAIKVAPTDSRIREAEDLAALGYRRLQIKVGDDPIADAEAVRAIVDVLDRDLEYLCCDANCGFSTGDALRFVRAIGEIDTYLEQPCASLAEVAQVRSLSGRPVIVDEAAKQPRDLLDALALKCLDGVSVKPARVGGLTKAARLTSIAQAAGLKIALDEPWGGLLATAGVVQLAATIDPEHLLAVSFFGDHGSAAAPSGGPRFADGKVSVPRGPGLGVIPDEENLGEPFLAIRNEDLADGPPPLPS